MIDIPSEIEKLLTKGEVVDHKFELKSNSVFTAKNRLIIKSTNSIRDILYSSIVSIDLYTRRNWLIFFIGIAVILCAICLRQLGLLVGYVRTLEGELTWGYNFEGFYYIAGVTLMVVGFFLKSRGIKLKIANPHDEINLSGYAEKNINELLGIVNERRPQLSETKKSTDTEL